MCKPLEFWLYYYVAHRHQQVGRRGGSTICCRRVSLPRVPHVAGSECEHWILICVEILKQKRMCSGVLYVLVGLVSLINGWGGVIGGWAACFSIWLSIVTCDFSGGLTIFTSDVQRKYSELYSKAPATATRFSRSSANVDGRVEYTPSSVCRSQEWRWLSV